MEMVDQISPQQESSIEQENREYLDTLKAMAREEALRRTVDQVTYTLSDQALATIPSQTNGVTLLHDYVMSISDDIAAYRSTLFYRCLKEIDIENVVEISEKGNDDFKPGDTLSFSKLPDTVYNQIQTAVRQSPVYVELKRISDTIKNAAGNTSEIEISAMGSSERYILLRTLGINALEISDLLAEKTSKSLPHYPGFSLTMTADDKLVIEYNPASVAEIAARTTFIYSQTGEGILLGLGKKHLSPKLENSLSEGYLNKDDTYKFSTRYGNGYADITRLLSSCIGRDEETIKTMIWEDPDHKISQDDMKQWLSLSNESPSPATREFFRTLHNVCSQNSDIKNPEIPTHSRYTAAKVISYRDGSCKDAESYYCNADTSKLKQSSPDFLEKCDYGVSTALVLLPIYVNSTLLKPGHLVKLVKDPDGNITGVQPLRCTMFMFNENEAQDAFGSQYEQTKERLDHLQITPLYNLPRTVVTK